MPDEAIPFQHMFRPPRGKPAGPRTSSSRLVLYDTGGHGDAFLTTGPQAGAWFQAAMAWLERWAVEKEAPKTGD